MEKWLAINIAYHAKSGSLFCIDPRNRLATLIKLPKHLHKDLQINPLSICAETSLNLMDIYHLMPAFSWCLPYNSCNKKKHLQHSACFCSEQGGRCFLLDTTKYVLKQTSKQPQQPSHPHEPEELESLDSEESEPESKLERKLSWHHRTHLFDKSLELLFLAFFCFFSFFSNFLAAYHHNCATLFFRKSEGSNQHTYVCEVK